jgi:type II secretory ATPase GspE/PulE/Tfp pilus assembly ATPase PilB-like protein
LAQRLLRENCAACARVVSATTEAMRELGATASGANEIRRGAGCAECRGTGYRGRLGIFELLVMDDALRDEVLRKRGAGELRAIAVAAGMRTLREDGLRLVMAGRTTPEEVLRVTRG